MPDAFTPSDLELFDDLERASRAVGVTPCLIGAGAIQIGAELGWEVRPTRMTRDWDFAVRVDSWGQFEELSTALTSEGGGFTRGREPHRFVHRLGGQLDVVPYGGLEAPRGTLRWPEGLEMDTAGLDVLDEHHQRARFESTALRVATLPALVGLKLLAYRARRPSIVRDIVDVAGILRDVEGTFSPHRVEAEALERLQSEAVGYGEVGSYLLGRDVGRVFAAPEREAMGDLLAEIDSARPTILSDGAPDGPAGRRTDALKARLEAFRQGLLDG